MGEWSKESKSNVAFMEDGDFYGSEKSVTLPAATDVRIELVNEAGETVVLKEKLSLLADEVIDGSSMSVAKLREFYEQSAEKAKAEDVL
ncbi:NADP-dependent isocitrate dehydrogenase, partial [Wenyingzhuangia sp. 1_MG-2023]|nr:NADP-dependent isocitrate dehydrogenase [Wenyingzhuangia sp. 1_MG-2023]